MAGDWIKVRVSLRSHPKVVRIASALNADRLRVVGALVVLWGLFDEHSEDGRLVGYGASELDSEVSWTGFAEAMAGVGWVILDAEGATMPRFEAHNGRSAKRRGQEAERKRASRIRQPSGQVSASKADNRVTREEKSIPPYPLLRGWDERADVEANGKALGLGPWDQRLWESGSGGENWPTYKRRCQEAAASHGQAGGMRSAAEVLKGTVPPQGAVQ